MPNFNHIEQQNLYIAEPYQHINSLVRIENGGATTKHYRVIGVNKFPGDNHIYFDVFDLNGQRITPIHLNWNWENSASTPAPAVGDKPASEPSGNIGMIGGVHIWLEIKDTPSERATIPPPDNSSWYICFQLTDSTNPPPPPPPPPGEEKPPAIPVNLKVESITDKLAALTWGVQDQLAAQFIISWSSDLATWQSLTSQAMRATVPDLLPDTLYTFRVKATNQHGESAPAETQTRTVKTPDNPPPNPPPLGPEVGTVEIFWGVDDQLFVAHKSPLLGPAAIDPTRSYLEITIPKEQIAAMLDYLQKQGLNEIKLAVNLVHSTR